MRYWFGGVPERKPSRSTRLLAALSYFLIVIGFAILLVLLTTSCRQVEPVPTATPSSPYAKTDWKHPFDKVERMPEPCRCPSRDPLPQEDPRFLP